MSPKSFRFILISILSMIVVACGSLAAVKKEAPSPSSNPSSNPSSDPSFSDSSNGFSGKSNPDGSIQLSWRAEDNADGYLLKMIIDEAFLPIALLPGNITNYTLFNLPGDTEYILQILTIKGSERGRPIQITVSTPPEVADPLNVSPVFDLSAPLMDISNIDYSNLDMENFDFEAFTDPNNFIAQPLETEALVGPGGGELSVTATNGITYILQVPAGALRDEQVITLRAISEIPDLPLDGGLSVAVTITPETMVFDIPATLRILPPVGYLAPAGEIGVGFAFNADGSDFYLYPLETETSQVSSIAHLAKISPKPLNDPFFAEIAKLQWGGGYGVGSGSKQQVAQVSNKRPSSSAKRTAQKAALAQMDDLTPLLPGDESLTSLLQEEELTPLMSPQQIQFAKIGESIRQQASKANSLAKLMETLETYKVYLNSDANKYNKALNEKILNILVEKAYALLKQNKGQCLTQEDFMAQDLVESLNFPKSAFSEAMAKVFLNKYGGKLLEDLYLARKDCKYEMSINSTLTFEAEGSKLTAINSAPQIKLLLTYKDGEIFLTGKGNMDLSSRIDGEGCSFPVKHYPTLVFQVEKLSPIYADGALTDFSLINYSVKGWQKGQVKGSSTGTECITSLTLSGGGGDYWTGLFTIARFTLDNGFIMDWKIVGAEKNITATWESVVGSFTSSLAPGGSLGEDTRMEIRIRSSK